MDPIQSLKRLKQRQQDAAEMLWGDGRLRESLADEQAAQLLDWAVRFVKAELVFTVDLADEATEAYFDSLVTAVRHLLRQINYLTANLAGLDDSEAEIDVKEFLDGLHLLTGRSVFDDQIELLLAGRQTWTNNDIFQRIMNILTLEPEEE